MALSLPQMQPGPGNRAPPAYTAMSSSVSQMSSASGNLAPTNERPMPHSMAMDCLYTKSTQMKSWQELSKHLKQCLIEKRPLATDSNDRYQMQKCLDTIQKNIEVTSVQSMVERLEMICRQLKLKFNVTKNFECFVSSDMYYVEIKLDQKSGKVLDCKITHENDAAVSCQELIEALQKNNFSEFTKHLEGLSSIYQIDTDKRIKTKVYTALTSLESDLIKLYEFQNNHINDINNLVHKSPAGVLEPRKGGYPMKLTFFVPPYDLIDLKTGSTFPLNVETILSKRLGYSATVCIEATSSVSIQHRLQNESLFTTKMVDGKSLPHFIQYNQSNANTLPARFILKLTNPFPICVEVVKKISCVTGIHFGGASSSVSIANHQEQSLISLLSSTSRKHQKPITSNKFLFRRTSTNASKKFYTHLPDQIHSYYVNDGGSAMKSILVDKIPFAHPTNVSRILKELRQQILFNVILMSVIREDNSENSKFKDDIGLLL